MLCSLHLLYDMNVMQCNFPLSLDFLGAVTSQNISTEEEQEVNVLQYLLYNLKS
jgi:hypothetical protein